MWIVQGQKIIDCPVTVRDIYISHAILGKNIADLKGSTNNNIPTHVVR